MSSWMMAVASVPLLPVMVVVYSRHGDTITKLCRGAVAWTLRLARGQVCARTTHAFVLAQSTHGQAESVLETFDLYARTHASASIGPLLGEALDEVVGRVHPDRVLELGTHCGYTAVSVLRLLGPTARLLSVEQDPQVADLAEEIILVAGFKHAQFQVLTGESGEVIPTLHSSLEPTQGSGGGFQLVLMDHDPRLYLLDLLALEREGLLCSAGCSIIFILREMREKSVQELKELTRERHQTYCITSQMDALMEISFSQPSIQDLSTLGK
ncbi:transmembrane O-methyltransferase homolog [Nerophis lumbriciformis]|uniref:transmembrane O-methyltransferase homolog n=1 Tax=Nerophis lumbriciformis TaxID=546530 RepID=UPI002AE0630D|nr:transmembrane O-methyltransferase homolog [Nerophis lumbriciformis]XP_061833287.1 transmembrane O-methyltransferase homolog [Nerophis lumbriciformis]